MPVFYENGAPFGHVDSDGSAEAPDSSYYDLRKGSNWSLVTDGGSHDGFHSAGGPTEYVGIDFAPLDMDTDDVYTVFHHVEEGGTTRCFVDHITIDQSLQYHGIRVTYGDAVTIGLAVNTITGEEVAPADLTAFTAILYEWDAVNANFTKVGSDTDISANVGDNDGEWYFEIPNSLAVGLYTLVLLPEYDDGAARNPQTPFQFEVVADATAPDISSASLSDYSITRAETTVATVVFTSGTMDANSEAYVEILDGTDSVYVLRLTTSDNITYTGTFYGADVGAGTGYTVRYFGLNSNNLSDEDTDGSTLDVTSVASDESGFLATFLAEIKEFLEDGADANYFLAVGAPVYGGTGTGEEFDGFNIYIDDLNDIEDAEFLPSFPAIIAGAVDYPYSSFMDGEQTYDVGIVFQLQIPASEQVTIGSQTYEKKKLTNYLTHQMIELVTKAHYTDVDVLEHKISSNSQTAEYLESDNGYYYTITSVAFNVKELDA